MRHFCTYFDHRYLPRGLALYQSLIRHCPSFTLSVLCMDRPSCDVLTRLRLPNVDPIRLEELEAFDPDLLHVKATRAPIEYFFTCTPALPLYILEQRRPEIDLLTYLDADLFFFGDPAPIFEEIGGSSVAIIEHRFPPAQRQFERYGIYNVGWVSFRRDEEGRRCLQWWRARCLEWCFDRCEDGRFADQKYLDDWERRFENVVSIRHKGANLAPWNVMNYRIRVADGQVRVDEEPLVFFHFHGFRRLNAWVWDTNLGSYGATASPTLRTRVFRPYIRALATSAEQLRRRTDLPMLASEMREFGPTLKLRRSGVGRVGQLLDVGRRLRTHEYLLELAGHARRPRPGAGAPGWPRSTIATPDVVVFLYIPKAAGSTLRTVVERQYPPGSVWRTGTAKVTAVAEELTRLTETERASVRCVTGHMTFGLHRHLAWPVVYITMLRHPVERVISHYYYVLRTPGHELHGHVVSRRMSLEDYVRSGISTELNDGQVRLVCGGEDAEAVAYGEVSRAMLVAAQRNLDEHFAAVGLAERFDESLLVFQNVLGWSHVHYLRRNVTESRPPRSAIPAATIRAIELYNALDLELYDRAAARLDELLRRLGIGWRRRLAVRAGSAAYGLATTAKTRLRAVGSGRRAVDA